MGKNKKKTAIIKKEEEKAQKVVINYFGTDYADRIFLFRLIDSLQIIEIMQRN